MNPNAKQIIFEISFIGSSMDYKIYYDKIRHVERLMHFIEKDKIHVEVLLVDFTDERCEVAHENSANFDILFKARDINTGEITEIGL